VSAPAAMAKYAMSKMNGKTTKSKLPFMRAYNSLLEKSAKDLTPAEKLVLIVICRYWPNPCWNSNQTIAKNLGFSERYVEMIIRRLAGKKYITKGFAHTDKGGKPHTVRVIVPLCFSEKCSLKIKWILPEQPFGQQTEQQDGQHPNNRSFPPEQPFDLIERSRKRNREATPTLSPAGAASAPPEDEKTRIVSNVQRLTKGFCSGQRKTPVLTQQKFEQKRKEQIKALQFG
jgi:hypothetical protein